MDGNITLPTKHYFAYKDSYSQSYDFSSGHVCIWELNNIKKKLSAEELMSSNCGAGEDSWESLGQQGNQPGQY